MSLETHYVEGIYDYDEQPQNYDEYQDDLDGRI